MHRRLFHGTPPVLMARLSRSRLTAVVVNSNANITNNNENTTAVQNHKDTSFSHNGQSAWSVVEAVKPMKAPSQQTPSRPPSQRLQKAVANDILSKLFKSERVKKKDDIDDNNSILEKSSSPTAVLDIDNQSTLSPSTDPPPDKKLKESVENTSSSLSASTSHSKGLNKAELDQEEEKRSLHHTASETVKQLYAFEQEDEMHGSIRRSEVDTTSVTPAWYEGAIFNAPPHRQQLEEKSGNKFVPRWMRNTQQQQQDDDDEEEVMEEEDSIIGQTLPALQLKSIIKLVNENYGSNTAVIDVRSRSDTFDYIIITEGRSTKQLYSIADAVKRYARKHVRLGSSLMMPDELKIEGEDSEDWMLLDMGHIMLHVFLPEARAHYNLDSMWRGEDPEVERIVRYFPTEDEGEGENEMLMELEDVHPHRSNTAELIKESIRSRHSTPRYM